ncbi:MAG: hypothetical protein JO061_17700 [Acidobacteriaceae bacterium]|nr:hypothetical protein [Acidobacteriaceae bacterium]
MKNLSCFLSVLLSFLLGIGPISAQSSSDLQIHVTNPAEARVDATAALDIQVTDQTGAAVSDAAVVVRLPESGVTAIMPDGTHAAVAYTDQNGRAHVTGIHWGAVPGSASIRITATRGTAHAGILVDESVSPVQASSQPALNSAPAAVRPAEPTVKIAPLVANPAENLAKASVEKPTTEAAPVLQPGTVETPRTIPPPAATPDVAAPRVSVVNAPTHEKIRSGGISKKWILLAVVAAGAGAGFAMVGKGKSSSSNTNTGASIGTPTVNVGGP